MTEFTGINHSFDVHIAAKYGITEAIIISHICYWIDFNRRTKKNFHQGRTWFYDTLDDIRAHFPYLTKDQVFNAIYRLCNGKSRKSKKKDLDFEPVLLIGNFNQTTYDRTAWYSFIDESKWLKQIPILDKAKMDIGESQNGNWNNPTPIPHTIPDTKPIEVSKDTSFSSASDSADATKPTARKQKIKKNEVAPKVFLTEKDEKSLRAKYGDEFYMLIIQKLSKWKVDTGQIRKSDMRAIYSWVIEAVKNDIQKEKYQKELTRKNLVGLKRIYNFAIQTNARGRLNIYEDDGYIYDEVLNKKAYLKDSKLLPKVAKWYGITWEDSDEEGL